MIEKKDDVVNRCPDCGERLDRCECFDMDDVLYDDED